MSEQPTFELFKQTNDLLRNKVFKNGVHEVLNQSSLALHVDRGGGGLGNRQLCVRIFDIRGRVLNDHMLVVLDKDGDLIEFSWQREVKTGQTIYRSYNVPHYVDVQLRFMKMVDFMALSRRVEALNGNDTTNAESVAEE